MGSDDQFQILFGRQSEVLNRLANLHRPGLLIVNVARALGLEWAALTIMVVEGFDLILFAHQQERIALDPKEVGEGCDCRLVSDFKEAVISDQGHAFELPRLAATEVEAAAIERTDH